MNSFSKNLTGERKGTFTSLDVSGQFNIDDNGSFLNRGSIISSGSITARHGEFADLYVKSFSCTNASFDYVEFNENYVDIATAVNLSIINGCFTTLNNVSKDTFSYIGTLNSDAQTQMNNISTLAHSNYNTLLNLSGVVSNVSSVA